MKDFTAGVHGDAVKTDLPAVEAVAREIVNCSLHHSALFCPVHQILQIGPAPGCYPLDLRSHDDGPGPAKNIDLAPGAPEVPGENGVTE